jgi:hypothetical protein
MFATLFTVLLSMIGVLFTVLMERLLVIAHGDFSLVARSTVTVGMAAMFLLVLSLKT